MPVISALAFVSGQSWFDPYDGKVVQASLYFYRAGTLDPITVYIASDLGVPHATPVLTLGSGRVPPVWVGAQPDPGYRIRIFDQYSSLLEDIDNIPGPVIPGEISDAGTVLPTDAHLLRTGELIFAFANAPARPGAVLCNGTFIGNASAAVGAGGRANADTENLFKWLWGQDAWGSLPMSDGAARGPSATSDWNGNRAIAVPDLMGRVLVGMDAMGGVTAKNRLAGVAFGFGDQAKLGSYGGAAAVTLAASQIPDHGHAVYDPSHQHYGVTPDHLHYNAVGIGTDGSPHQHYVSGTTDTESHDHTHYQIGGGPALQGFGDTGGRVSAYAGAQTGGRSAAHTHNLNVWTLAGYGAHTHNAVHYPAAADRSLAFWVDARFTGISIYPTTGGGGSHTNTQPFMTMCVYMVL
jgi:hypothetical protein